MGEHAGHQLPKPLPGFAQFWEGLDEVFAWLTAILRPRYFSEPLRAASTRLGSRQRDRLLACRVSTRTHSLRRCKPLKVEIDYRAEQGRSGPRIVEPYSLRRTSEGNILLFVINDRGCYAVTASIELREPV